MPPFKVSNLSSFAVSRGILHAGRYPLLGIKRYFIDSEVSSASAIGPRMCQGKRLERRASALGLPQHAHRSATCLVSAALPASRYPVF